MTPRRRVVLLSLGMTLTAGCASGGSSPDTMETGASARPVPVYNTADDIACAYEPMGTAKTKATFSSARNLSRDIATALGEAGARNGAHAVIRSTNRIKVPFTVERLAPGDLPVRPGGSLRPGDVANADIDRAARGAEFPVEGLMIRFSEPCLEAGFDGAATDTIPGAFRTHR